MENSNYKSGNIERKYLKNMEKNQFLKVKNKIIVSIDNMDKFREKK